MKLLSKTAKTFALYMLHREPDIDLPAVWFEFNIAMVDSKFNQNSCIISFPPCLNGCSITVLFLSWIYQKLGEHFNGAIGSGSKGLKKLYSGAPVPVIFVALPHSASKAVHGKQNIGRSDHTSLAYSTVWPTVCEPQSSTAVGGDTQVSAPGL